MQAHVFFAGDHRTHRGERICESCGDIERAKVHQLPEVSEDARELDARRIGEPQEVQS